MHGGVPAGECGLELVAGGLGSGVTQAEIKEPPAQTDVLAANAQVRVRVAGTWITQTAAIAIGAGVDLRQVGAARLTEYGGLLGDGAPGAAHFGVVAKRQAHGLGQVKARQIGGGESIRNIFLAGCDCFSAG